MSWNTRGIGLEGEMSRWVGDNDKSSISAVDQLSECFEELLKNGQDLSDITFVVDNKEFYLHRCVLASRSSYFRALLFGGMRESQEDKVELRDTTDAAFSKLIFFIYTGRIELQLLDKDLVLDILRLAHRYGLGIVLKQWVLLCIHRTEKGWKRGALSIWPAADPGQHRHQASFLDEKVIVGQVWRVAMWGSFTPIAIEKSSKSVQRGEGFSEGFSGVNWKSGKDISKIKRAARS